MLRSARCVLALLVAAPAAAQGEAGPTDESSARPMTGQVPALDAMVELGLLSDHRFRGVSRSDEDPSARAALTFHHESGLYAGVRGTTLSGIDSWRQRDLGDLQLDLYIGGRTPLGSGFDLDAGVTYYLFAGGDGVTDHVEPYASLGYLIGPVQLSAGGRYAPSQRALGNEDMLYLFGQADFTLPFRPWQFTARLGRQSAGAFDDYWEWSLAATHQLRIEGIPDSEIALSYVDTDLPSGPGRDAGIVLSIALRF